MERGIHKEFSFQIVSPQPNDSHHDDDDYDNANDRKHAAAVIM